MIAFLRTHLLRAFALGPLLALSLPSAAQALISRWTSADLAGQNITALAINSDARVSESDLRFAPPLIYAGTANGGVFISTDGSTTWTAFNTGLPDLHITALATYIQPQNTACAQCPLPAQVFAGTSSAGIFRKVDSGWVPVNTGLTNLSISSLSAVPERGTLYAGTIEGGVFRSGDLGATWTAVSSGLSSLRVRALAAVPSSPSVVFAGTNDGTFKTIDGGASWSRLAIDPQFFRFDATAFAIDRTSSWTVLAAGFIQCTPPCGALPTPAVYRSTDGGTTWTAVGDLAIKFVQVLTVSFSEPAVFWAGLPGGGVLESSDGGRSWTAVNEGLGSLFISALAVDPFGRVPVYSATATAGVYRAVLEAGGCTASPSTLCLVSGRFRVTVSWRDPAGSNRAAQAIPLTSKTGAFWFFEPTNLEVAIKILDGRAVNGKFWVFIGPLTGQEYTVSVTDTAMGTSKTYFNPAGQPGCVADTSAFP